MYLIFFFVLYYIKNIQESNANNNNANSYAPKTRKKNIPTPPAETVAKTVTVAETLKAAQWRKGPTLTRSCREFSSSRTG